MTHMERLQGILNNSLGLIELNADLDVEAVTEIFVRINSQGVALNAADFAMSKMAASERHNGHLTAQVHRLFLSSGRCPGGIRRFGQGR